ncbi:hypothetical protein PAECIP111892_03208 [Paenibacillus auburnensis]|uniref:Uncharacterized protein n=1 Tax=Paenibacillus auburnensis TaxID=2905649 RepID=A0ABN8GHF0_9BACL|nr:hypothetical protein PAECIP111892_03208 [Paenibacillus auburnensis]
MKIQLYEKILGLLLALQIIQLIYIAVTEHRLNRPALYLSLFIIIFFIYMYFTQKKQR